ncbi:hypothetical protein QQS21_006910 [Conoideocrella luteorostrata]|uniref:Uncharacterized protein n=1 Tax=Conoideocrella luteorostrata TaxID=1105319 RepID=A0AAJ0CLV6_9HYPO|nr:hypothetical protein QQS21_006910 [Conoideocrella luteorostrata]
MSLYLDIYKPDERLSSNFLLRTKDTLASMAKLPDELRQQFPLDLDNNESGTPRISAHIHLLFHQCIILATRPILFCLYKIRLETPHSYTRIFDSSPSVQSLLRMCLDSSQHVVSILECLQREDLIETFLSYDLEALSISMTNLLVAPVLYQGDGSNWASWRHRAFSILDEIAQSGNLIAQCHESELKRLQQMIEILTGVSERTPESPRHAPVSTTVTEPPAGAGFSDPEAILPSPITEDVLDGNYTGAGFSTSQIMDMVNSIDTEHSEWMTEAFFEYT